MDEQATTLWDALGIKKAIILFWSAREFGNPPLTEIDIEKITEIIKLLKAITGMRSSLVRHHYNGTNAKEVANIFLNQFHTGGHGASKLLCADYRYPVTLINMVDNMLGAKDILVLIMEDYPHIKEFLDDYIAKKKIDVEINNPPMGRNTALVLLVGDDSRLIQVGY